MKKLSLELDQLAVESFETAGGAGPERGTVRGNALSDCCTLSCAGTCGVNPTSNDANAIPTTGIRCVGDTEDITGCQPCCV